MITKKLFDHTADGREVYAYTLENGTCVSARIINFGGTIVNLWVKDAAGNTADVICGFDDMYGYENAGGYQGAIIGRVCNRIHDSRYTLDGVDYELFANDGPNSAHGGKIGFNKHIWDAKIISEGDEPELELTYVSPDMEENYPGTLTVKTYYKLTCDAGLSIRFVAETDKPTIVNLTNHAYYNLAGYESGTILDQVMWIDSDKINEQDVELIPTGNFVNVEGTAYDFRSAKAIGRDFNSEPSMSIQNGGYDNNYIINGADGKTVKLCATLTEPVSGRKMEVYTNQPCVQVYTSNMINENDLPFKGGVRQLKNCAVCFETQKMPDSINHPGFTETVLRPGEVYDFTSIYKFSAK